MVFELHFEISFECPSDRCAVVNKTIIDVPHGLCYISKTISANWHTTIVLQSIKMKMSPAAASYICLNIK